MATKTGCLPLPLRFVLLFIALAVLDFVFDFQVLRYFSPTYVHTPNNLIKHEESSPTIMSWGYKDYIKDDYRAFIFATHPKYGLLLLYCDRKKKKPPHFQAPGGHVDEANFLQHKDYHDGSDLLIRACKTGAARLVPLDYNHAHVCQELVSLN